MERAEGLPQCPDRQQRNVRVRPKPGPKQDPQSGSQRHRRHYRGSAYECDRSTLYNVVIADVIIFVVAWHHLFDLWKPLMFCRWKKSDIAHFGISMKGLICNKSIHTECIYSFLRFLKNGNIGWNSMTLSFNVLTLSPGRRQVLVNLIIKFYEFEL